ncbi:helix-turn-helix transcriptional regulator [Budviciaceae bacterium CWB-B4]|uniref:Helix-turn-helix transcriptional regulator n=1 Tax=Limnobaculum xujianqingii TaxID=2738837 RepID=A0A9D7ALW0_9GAMM|nr:S24 family peptidase [Limnobaculum xujianqingii]MBK5075196.1 helix-turn-helix transcriptional regulator [Limnobaculum xujianqingii]MBK5178510.1 helix-turn-helix transcriptional regulator [Limnobaculum xujianqingii]
MKTGERIRALRKAKKMTILELATAIGSDVGNVSRLERGVQGYKESTLKNIADALGVTVAEIYSIDNEQLDSIKRQEKVKVEKPYSIEFLDIEASAGLGVVNNDVIQTVRLIEYANDHAKLLFGGRNPNDIKIITVVGDSMSGTIEPGDAIFVDVSKDYFSGDGIYVFTFKNTLHVKRLQMMPDHLLVHSDNHQYKDWEVTEENEEHLKISGKVLLSQSQAYKRHG